MPKFFFLLRPIADHIAEREVARRKPQSDATARSRVESQVRREMDTEVSEQFANAEEKLQADVYGPLRELGWYPQSIRMSTTETELLVRARLTEPTELGGSLPSLSPVAPADGIVIQVHESALNNGSARLDVRRTHDVRKRSQGGTRRSPQEAVRRRLRTRSRGRR